MVRFSCTKIRKIVKDNLSQICIAENSSILDALKQMDIVKHRLLIVTNNGKFCSMLSIGDIQRAIIKGVELSRPVSEILREKTNVATIHDSRESIKTYISIHKNEFMPVVDDVNNIVEVLFWDELFNTDVIHRTAEFNLPVIIMAGGKGTRLRPLTNVLPKPLIPIGEQTMMEDIMDRFVECGCHDFYVSVNYKAEIIKRYLNNLNKPQYNISYFQEDKPLGTAGSLHLLKDKIKDTFFVSNCDIIIEEDYGEILKYHCENHNEITVVAAIKNLAIPYGTLETKEEGLLSDIKEKPEYTFKINTGMYILEPHLIDEIPQDEFYHITFLIEKLVKEGRRVGVYPINEGSWIDVGNWDEYFKYIRR